MKRINDELPGVKLIAILRNPVDRAYSNYNHQVRMKREHLSFEEAIDREQERIAPGEAAMMEDSRHNDYDFLMFSYLRRGRYAEQLERCFRYFARENVLVLQAERLAQNLQAEYDIVLQFLGLPAFRLPDSRRHNAHEYAGMSEEMRRKLEAYFAPQNQRLYNLLNRDFGW